ncbi:MAG: YggS family pyridoxal phosphate-dependent enzyme [Candidatus Krumholzibacteriota bacterium]|nr:YggS family pyridoxal phosphate-dependent enzyme [Candidatus Krumholzibacteriota bacterium]
MSIGENYRSVLERVAEAASRAGRDPSGITVVGVTKTHPAATVREAIEAGIVDVGENRVQEFLAKAPAVDLPCRWHLVGHLQTNKVAKAIGRFHLVHSVDSLRLAEKLGRAGMERGLATDVLLEVNTSGEAAKYGFDPDETVDCCGAVAAIDGLRLRGLMTVGPWVDDVGVVAGAFQLLRRLRNEADAALGGGVLGHLSMGMTDDFEIAIAEGSTIVRLGRILFGARGA